MLTQAGPQILFRLPEEALLLTRPLPNLQLSPPLSSSQLSCESRLWFWVLSVPYLSYRSGNYQISCHFTRLEVVGGKLWSGFRFHGWVGECFPVTSGILNLLRKFSFLGCLAYGCENGGFVPETHLVYKTKSGLCLVHLESPCKWYWFLGKLPVTWDATLFLSKIEFLGPDGPNKLKSPKLAQLLRKLRQQDPWVWSGPAWVHSKTPIS
jgi:hypothetical protein